MGGLLLEKKKKKNTTQLIYILSKGTTVSSVRAQMVLCLRKREEVLGIEFYLQAMKCPKYCLLQPELK